jgi:hypothetical protein
MTGLWSEEMLDAARAEGDPEADALVARTLARNSGFLPGGRTAYNYLQWAADTLIADPQLALVRDATLAGELARFPRELVDYFMPVEAPAWVDAGKLEVAGRLWEQNALGIIEALYAASLPACYLLRRGIVALYETARLTDRRYVYQRVYETGLFVEAVMSPGGLRVFSDIERGLDQYGSRSAAASAPRRFLWGKGFVFARQVRFLHASMRFMLTHPERPASAGQPTTVAESLDASEWRSAFGGEMPINQEDLAYTLLTFGFLIPQALAKWGCRWSPAQKGAHLHLWKTVGHVMGIRDALLTDDWDRAEQLFTAIRARQAAPSEMGCLLADAVMDMFADYLPGALGISRNVPPLLIRHQLGAEYADMIFTGERRKAAGKLLTRLVLRLGLGLLHLYYGTRNTIFRRFRTMGAFMGDVFAHAGEEMIKSWRDEYRRRPFDVPAQARVVPRLEEESLALLRAWRRRVSYMIGAGVALFAVSVLSLLGGGTLYLLGQPADARAALWLTLGAFAAAIYTLKWSVARVARSRPTFTPADASGD